MQHSLTILDAASLERVLYTWSNSRIGDDIKVSDRSLTFSVELSLDEAAILTTDRALVAVYHRTGRTAYYRLIRPVMLGNRMRFEGVSMAHTSSDTIYSALWSTKKTRDWSPVYDNQLANWRADRWTLDTNNRLYLGPTRSTQYSAAQAGGLSFAVPAGSSRMITMVEFDFTLVGIDTQWTAELYSINDDFSSLSAALWQYTTIAGTNTGKTSIAIGGRARVMFSMRYNGVGTISYAGETGTTYCSITNVRVVTTAAIINTTLSLAIAAPGTVAATPVSMSNIAVGAVISMGQIERVTVLSVTATTFTATFTSAHGAGTTVKGYAAITSNQVLGDVVATVAAANPTQLKAATVLLQNPGTDESELSFIRQSYLDIAKNLAARAGWAYGITEERVAYFWPKGSYARTYHVVSDDIEQAKPWENTYNQLAATYTDAKGTTQMTAYTSDAIATARLGLTRQKVISADTTSATAAATIRDLQQGIDEQRTIQPRYKIRRLTDAFGKPAWPEDLRQGDTIVVVNLPIILAPTLAERSIVIAEVKYSPITNIPEVTPESPLPTLDVLLAQRTPASAAGTIR